MLVQAPPSLLSPADRAQIEAPASLAIDLSPCDDGSLTVAAALRGTQVDGGELGARIDSLALSLRDLVGRNKGRTPKWLTPGEFLHRR